MWKAFFRLLKLTENQATCLIFDLIFLEYPKAVAAPRIGKGPGTWMSGTATLNRV